LVYGIFTGRKTNSCRGRQVGKEVGQKRLVIDNIFDETKSWPTDPLVFFMAGSPGAGKTEISKAFVDMISNQTNKHFYARIDPDEIRGYFKECGYDGSNAYLFQNPVSILVSDVMSHLCKTKASAVVDGTLANYEIARKNLRKVITSKGFALRQR